jgi:hypothetical protein
MENQTMIRHLLLLTLVIISTANAAPQTQPSTQPLRLIPTPQSVQLTGGRFKIGVKLSVAKDIDIPDEWREQVAVLHKQIDEELSNDLGVRVSDVVLGGCQRENFIEGAKQHLDGRALPDFAADEGYGLEVGADGVVVVAPTPAGLFYGVQTLKQLIRANADPDGSIPCCRIVDWPGMRYRAWQDDISRGPIPTMDFLKREIRQLSEMKYNAMTLYTEHVFKLKKHPDIAPADGISADQIKELVAYAKPYHVEVIGNFQSFGHFKNILATPGYEFLGDDDWSLSPAKEESYKFLADAYAEVAPAYESKLFNINCDEVSIGKGATKDMVEKMGLGGVYAYHINRIVDLLKPYNNTAMMWGDIATQHQEIVPKLPKDLIVLSWGYGAEKSFDKAIEPFTKIGLRFWVCPGVSNWNRVYPDFQTATVNIANYVRDGVKSGAMGMLNTTWDDDGETLFGYHWYPLAWGAEVAWNPPAESARLAIRGLSDDQRIAEFNDSFDGCFYGIDASVSDALWQLSSLRKNPSTGDLRDQAFWRDNFRIRADDAPALADVNLQRLRSDADHLLAVLQSLKREARLNQDTIDDAIFAARRLVLFAQREQLLNRIREVASRGELIGPRARQELSELADQVRQLKETYSKLWSSENRPWWLDKVLAKYDQLAQRLLDTPMRVAIGPQETTFSGSINVELLALSGGGEIRYTTDDSDPTPQSIRYNGPIHLTSTTKIRAKHFVRGLPTASIVDEQTYRTYRYPCVLTTSLQTYEDNLPIKAFDGSQESSFWGLHKGGGGIRADDHFTIALKQPLSVHLIRVVTGDRDNPDDKLHHGVLEGSTDGTTWQQLAEFKRGIAEAKLDPAQQVKAIRIRATQDQDNWLIIREVLLNDDAERKR